jgi:hypothetical protein
MPNDQLFKADAGKLRPSLLMEGVPRALLAVTAVLTYGAQKYEAHSWKNVDMSRYQDAKFRHMFEELLGYECNDAESGLLHEAHELCNQMFLLEAKLAKLAPEDFYRSLTFKAPPQAHKAPAQ